MLKIFVCDRGFGEDCLRGKIFGRAQIQTFSVACYKFDSACSRYVICLMISDVDFSI